MRLPPDPGRSSSSSSSSSVSVVVDDDHYDDVLYFNVFQCLDALFEWYPDSKRLAPAASCTVQDGFLVVAEATLKNVPRGAPQGNQTEGEMNGVPMPVESS